MGVELNTGNINLDVFYDIFLSDDCKYSIAEYQKELFQDYDFTITPWEIVKCNSISQENNKEYYYFFYQERSITYQHPLPLSSAEATKKQVLYKFPNVGIWLETYTKVNDFKLVENFQVEDVMIIEPCQKGLIISAYFNIQFHNNTWFRNIIEKTTTDEMQKYFNGFLLNVESYLQKLTLKVTSNTSKKQPLPKQPPPKNYNTSYTSICVWILSFLVICLLIFQQLLFLHTSQQMFLSLQAQIIDIQSNSNDTLHVIVQAINILQQKKFDLCLSNSV